MTIVFLFFWGGGYNVFLTIGKCRFSDCVTHNLVNSRFDGLSLIDFRFNSLNRNSVFTLYINHEKYTTKSICVITLTTTTFSFFFFKIGVYVVCSYCFSFTKKKRCKGADDVVVKFFRLKKECVSTTLKRTFFRSKQ